MKKAIQIKNAPAPIGPYSQAIQIKDTLYVSGQIPLNPLSGELEMEDIEQATHRVMKNIGSLLQEAGMAYADIVKCSIFLKDMNEFAAMNHVYASYFESLPPARETVQVVQLPMNVNVEISCIAVK